MTEKDTREGQLCDVYVNGAALTGAEDDYGLTLQTAVRHMWSAYAGHTAWYNVLPSWRLGS